MLRPDPPHRAGTSPHDDTLGGHAPLAAALDALEQRAVGDAGCGEDAVAFREDLDRIYKLEDLAKGDCIFAATGVTDGSLLEGVKYKKAGCMTTESVVMRASSGTVRWVKGEHHRG